MTHQDRRTDHKNAGPDLLAGWVIGVYLVLEVAVLGCVGVMFWLSSSMQQLLSFPLHPPGFEFLRESLSPDKFPPFRQLALAACSAGAGGSVFMIREFYISFAYGFEKDGVTRYLKNVEIPRYILLPFSSVVLGPVSIFLLQAGAIVFAGSSPDKSIPDYTVMAVSFLFGFSYHDSLKALGRFSSKMLGGKKEPKEG
jgi:hypothetical protein